MTDRLGIGFLSHPGVPSMVVHAQAAEAAGFESAWVAETRISRDAVVPVAAILYATQRLRVGTSAINVFTRGAALTAITAATLAELAPGRVVLGLGTGSPEPLKAQGFDFDRPFTRLREAVTAIRATWRGPWPVSYEGQTVALQELDPELRPDPEPPIYLCTSGPRALRYAGEAAEGVIVDVLLPTSFVAHARSLLDEGAGGEYQGELAAALLVSVADSRGEAAARLRPTLARYLVGFPELAQKLGLDPEFLARIGAVAESSGVAQVLPLLSDDLVCRFAVCGTGEQCRDRIGEYRAAGVDLPILFSEPNSFEKVIRAVAT